MEKQHKEIQPRDEKIDWRSFFEEWQKSSLSQRAFCREKAINYANFIYWRKKFIQQQHPKPDPLVPVIIKQLSSSQPVDQKLEVHLPNQVLLSIPSGYDRETLQIILQVLGMKSC